jgi:hypothetical protein
VLYFARTVGSSSTLNRIGFDGTSFTGGATILSEIVPTFDAMSLIYTTEGPIDVPAPSGLPVLVTALAVLGLARRRRDAA